MRTVGATIKDLPSHFSRARAVHCLVSVTVAIYLVAILGPLELPLGSVPLGALKGDWWRLITANFLHLALWHVTANMLGLLIFGPPLERMVGATRFLGLYVCSGVLAMFIVSLGGRGAAGASGGLAGVLGALVVLAWRRRHRSEAMRGLVIMALASSTLFLLSGSILWAISGIPVADDAHLAGFVTGLLVGPLLEQGGRLRPSGSSR